MSTPPSAATLNALTSIVVSSAIDVHRYLGPGLLERAYLTCLVHDLSAASLRLETQRPVPLVYRGVRIDCAYRADLIVENAVLVEIKALEVLAPIHTRQLRTYLRLADCRVGLLLNFGAPTMKAGIRRVVNGFPDAAA